MFRFHQTDVNEEERGGTICPFWFKQVVQESAN
jgi:hypothetical protein